MNTKNTMVVNGLLKWWNARFGIVLGNRNANIYKLAAAFNNYGIPQADALEVCLRYVDSAGADPLTEREITATVFSAYRRTEHGMKDWTTTQGSHTSSNPLRTLTHAQVREVEDRLVNILQKRFRTLVPSPTPACTAPPRQESRILSEPALILDRMAKRNAGISTLIDLLELDLKSARITSSGPGPRVPLP